MSLAPDSICVLCALPARPRGAGTLKHGKHLGEPRVYRGYSIQAEGGNNKNKSTETGMCWACIRGQLMRLGLEIQVQESGVQGELQRQTWPVWLQVTEHSAPAG